MKLIKCLLIFWAFKICSIEGARILAIFPFPSKSHTILVQPLMLELAKRGHEIVYASPYELKDPPNNYKNLIITEKKLFEIYDKEMKQAFEVIDANPLTMMKESFEDCAVMTESIIVDKEMQKLLNSKTEKFDLVFIDTLLTDALLGFGAHFKAKVIGISTFGQIHYLNQMIHSQMPLSRVVHPYLTYDTRMTFLQRMENIIMTNIEQLIMHFVFFPAQEKVYNKHFKSVPPFKEVLRNSVSLVLLNTHYSLNYPQANLPNMIEVAGFHVKNETNPLPEDIKTFIESANDGVIFFSLGSNVKPSLMDEQKKIDIIAALTKIKQKIIWKWDDETLNVDKDKFLIRKWLPQDDILAHPNVKLFITHGGLLSCIESIIRGKPVIGIPVFGDQMMNMARAELFGWGVTVGYTNLTEKSLSWALNEILSSNKYSENVKTIAKRFSDQPQSPMERAIYWFEYVLRNDGAHFMQTHYLNFIEENNLDVYFLFALVIFLIIFIPLFTIRKIMKCLCKRKSKKKLQ